MMKTIVRSLPVIAIFVSTCVMVIDADESANPKQDGSLQEHSNANLLADHAPTSQIVKNPAYMELILKWEELNSRFGSSHPDMNSVAQQIKNIEREHSAIQHEQKPENEARAERTEHIELAIDHLRKAGMHDEANMIAKRANVERARTPRPAERNRFQNVERNGEGRRDRRGIEIERHLQQAHEMMEQMGTAIANLEQRVKSSEEFGRAIEEAHRNIDHIQREANLRSRELEQNVRHKLEDLERFVDERSGGAEKIMENIDEIVHDKFEEFERFFQRRYVQESKEEVREHQVEDRKEADDHQGQRDGDGGHREKEDQERQD